MTLNRLDPGSPWQVEVAVYKNTGVRAYTCVFRAQIYDNGDDVWTAFERGIKRAMSEFYEKYPGEQRKAMRDEQKRAASVPSDLQKLAGGEIKAEVIK